MAVSVIIEDDDFEIAREIQDTDKFLFQKADEPEDCDEDEETNS